MLSATNVARVGYAIEQPMFSRVECEELLESLSALEIKRGRAGIRHLMRFPAVAAFASSDPLLALARQVLGEGAVPFRATLFDKSANANWLVAWHQDTALPLVARFESTEWGPWSRKEGIMYAHAPAWALSRVVALRVHLDASTAENGPLQVIPGSHSVGVLNDKAISEYVRKSDRELCPVERGGVLAMMPLLIHSSSKARNGDPRRVLHIEYAESLDFGGGISLTIA